MLPEGQIKRVALGAKQVALVQHAGSFYAFETACPHRRADLSTGFISPEGSVVCPLHAYRFSLQDGRLLHGGSCSDLRTYPCRLTEEGLEIRL
ncbi:Rieske (2Fe-2S) domain-containing protein [Nitritalea halalkaliphila LW7]|uniref:Rieske (2Fe-2S) domain-containing protein n=2 Tax=Nitritalea TaxID=1187887 RepID=I5C164_9BACT|nr:Rieske (2Fe-2S) domain-containing protein [Nitritalea halalkaliphila LW7]